MPKSTSEVQSFLGLASYHHGFINNFEKIAAPLTNLMSKRQVFRWTQTEAAAFEGLKKKLCTAPVLAYPDFTLGFRLKTNARAEAVGAVLCQLHSGVEKPIACASRKLKPVNKITRLLKGDF